MEQAQKRLDLGQRYHKAKEAAKLILSACGRSLEEPGLMDTPDRFAEFLTQEWNGWDPDSFLNGEMVEEFDEMIVVRDVPFMSLCEHHLLPYWGKAHVAYVPHSNRLAGLSKLARIFNHFAAGPSVQERVTKQVADFIDEKLQPKGVMVITEAQHFCMIARGAKAIGSSTTTSTIKGVFRDNPAAKSEMLSLIKETK